MESVTGNRAKGAARLRLVHGNVRTAGVQGPAAQDAPQAVLHLPLLSVRDGTTSLSAGVALRAFSALRPGERLEFVHTFHARDALQSRAGRYVFEVLAVASDGQAAARLGKVARDAMRMGFPSAQFGPPSQTGVDGAALEPMDHAWHLTLQPVIARRRPSIDRLAVAGPFGSTPVHHELPAPGSLPDWTFTVPFGQRMQLPPLTQIAIRIHGFELPAGECERIERCRQMLAGGSLVLFHSKSPSEDYAIAHALKEAQIGLLGAWLKHPKQGYALDCVIRSTSPIESAALDLIAADIFGQQEFLVRPCALAPGDLPGRIPLAWALRPEQSLPGMFPAVQLVPALGVPRHFEPPAIVPPSDGGARVGHTVCGEASGAVALPDANRSRHIACFGATGSGKSTFLLKLLEQDMASPQRHGVAVIDPHGSLVQDVLRHIPYSRVDDVILVDVTDTGRSASINPLAGMKGDPAYAQFVSNEIVSLIDTLFEGRDTSGPATKNHIRNMLLLAAHAGDREGTFMDALRCLEDADFAELMVARSKDRSLRAYWDKFKAARGDQGFSSWLPYLMPRLTPFCTSPAMRRLLNTPNRSVNIAQAMDLGKIVLFNISKAVLGDTECRIVGSVLLNQFFWAALARGKQPGVAHKPMHLVVDEFQSFATDSVPRLLAEARKFGLCLTTANQSLGQLRNQYGQPSIGQAVLANTATKLMFRLGPSDTDLMRPYFQPGFSDAEMTNLPDCHAVINMPGQGRPLPAFVAKIDRPVRDEARHASVARVINRAASKCTRPVYEVNEELAREFDVTLASMGHIEETAVASGGQNNDATSGLQYSLC